METAAEKEKTEEIESFIEKIPKLDELDIVNIAKICRNLALISNSLVSEINDDNYIEGNFQTEFANLPEEILSN